MSPIAKAINVLQGESNVHMGWLVHTITLLKVKLDNLCPSSNFCGSLLEALQAGIEKRFGQMLADPELIASAILLPKFKTCWTSDEAIHKLGLDYIRCHLKDHPMVQPSDSATSSEEEDFFSTIIPFKVQESTRQLEASV
ncbi:hypothetical protein NFI96_021355 [Prochilodus magdalenae]|nr:hypothetical protein NFI96_021355 [Prochilodus magdalenae]